MTTKSCLILMSSSSYCLRVDGFWHDVFNVTSIAAPGPSLEPYTYELQFKILASKIYRLPLTASYRSIFSNLSLYASLSVSLSLSVGIRFNGGRERASEASPTVSPTRRWVTKARASRRLLLYVSLSLSLHFLSKTLNHSEYDAV